MPDTVVSNTLEYSLADLSSIATDLTVLGEEQRVWLFYGNLGAGKTTLIKEISKQLGIEEKQMGSPTFSIINEYHSPTGKVFHFDFYRMKNEMEVLDLGIEEYFDSGNYCFVEWPERLGTLLPQQHFKIMITDSGTESRTIQYEKHG